MHELSLLASVVQVVEDAARTAHAQQVVKVCLLVGSQSGAIREALEGSWPIAIEGHMLMRDAELLIEEVTAAVWCPSCQQDVEIDEFFALQCPICATPTAQLTRGRECNVAWVEWET